MEVPGIKNVMKIVLFLVYTLIQSLDGDSEFEGLYHLPLEHSFDQGHVVNWSNRGVITIRSISNNLAQFVQAGPLTDDEARLLKDLSRTNGLYRIRVPANLETPTGQPKQYVTAFIRACALYESALSDLIVLNADGNGNSILGVSITSMFPVTCTNRPITGRPAVHWNSTVEIKQTVPAPVPDTVSYIQKMEKQKSEKAKGEQADNRSFLAKYWMYIVPVFVLMMVASSADQGGNGR